MDCHAMRRIVNHIIHYSKKSYQSNLTENYKPLIESLFCLLINRIKKIESPVKCREKKLTFHCKMLEKLNVL